MRVYNGWKFPFVKMPAPAERSLKLISAPEVDGYENATILFSIIPPGSSTGLHVHPTSDEIMFFVGRGETVVDGKTVPLENDSVLIVPKGLEHQCVNRSDTEMLKLYCVYVPPMPLSPALRELAARTRDFLASRREE